MTYRLRILGYKEYAEELQQCDQATRIARRVLAMGTVKASDRVIAGQRLLLLYQLFQINN